MRRSESDGTSPRRLPLSSSGTSLKAVSRTALGGVGVGARSDECVASEGAFGDWRKVAANPKAISAAPKQVATAKCFSRPLGATLADVRRNQNPSTQPQNFTPEG